MFIDVSWISLKIYITLRARQRAIAFSSLSDDEELGGEYGSRIDDGTLCIRAISMPLSAKEDREAIWDGLSMRGRWRERGRRRRRKRRRRKKKKKERRRRKKRRKKEEKKRKKKKKNRRKRKREEEEEWRVEREEVWLGFERLHGWI